MFLSAAKCPEVRSNAMMNLALVYLHQGERKAAKGDFVKAKNLITKATNNVETAKKLLDQAVTKGTASESDKRYLEQFRPLRIKCHRMLGSILFSLKDVVASENEFRKATESFPDVMGVWEMLARILDLQGKSDEVATIREKISKMTRGL